MAKLRIYPERIIRNIEKMNAIMRKYDKQWSLVTKVLGGNEDALKSVLKSDVIYNTHSIGDSRVSNLKTIKNIDENIVTMYLKPPAKSYIKGVVKYANISLNTDYETIHALDKEAARQKINHQVIIMIEMGELREGVVREKFLDFYKEVFNLPNIDVIGLGTNLGCMYGIEPTFDKLIQLSLYEQLIEMRFNQKIQLVSGGSSITLPLLSKGKIPKQVNHLRIGEAIFLGTTPLTNKKFNNLSTNTFELLGNIVEFEKKETYPDGVIGEGNVGHAEIIEENNTTEKKYRALIDFGLVDVDTNFLKPKDKEISFLGTTSDLTVYSLGKNRRHYKSGKTISFQPNYMAVAQLMNSQYITKDII
ncbi:MAG: alanine racemase [Candidatus Thermoplasmatota archaeon]|nr:alanine racemase [Candidatus Thermoplasmatota archaeon]MBU1941948.1 alanine racemase [Candidatus Thermoplasmatota archaeon]